MRDIELYESMGMGGRPAWLEGADPASVRGRAVLDADGGGIGEVADIYVDERGDVRYLAVETGWLGTRRTLVPVEEIAVMEIDEEWALVLPYGGDRLRQGPAFGAGDDLTVDRERAVYDHYGLPGYWEIADERQSTPAPTPEIAAADDAGATAEARRAGDVRARQTEPAPTPRIARAEVDDAVARGEAPESVRVRRWRA
jgi:PRC-barrel domain protein